MTYSSETEKIPYPSGFPDPDDPQWKVGEQFEKDVVRRHILVDGAVVATPQDLLDGVADRRAAAQLSRVMHQGAFGILANNAPPDLFQAYSLARPFHRNMDSSRTMQTSSVVALGGGAYRCTIMIHWRVDDPRQAEEVYGSGPAVDMVAPGNRMTDLVFKGSFILRTGDQPQIQDCETDWAMTVLPE